MVEKWAADVGGINALSAVQASLLDEAAEVALRPRRKGSLEDQLAAKNFIVKVMRECGLLSREPAKPSVVEPDYGRAAADEVMKQVAEAMRGTND